MGVSGCGKSTIGKLLSKKTNLPFFDADDFHPEANIKKMESGAPLNDKDRAPWLGNLNKLAQEKTKTTGAVIACSALKSKYRRRLEKGLPEMPTWVFLDGDFDLLLSRINSRADHFMPASLLQSQFDTLEKPRKGIKVDVANKPEEIIAKIMVEISTE